MKIKYLNLSLILSASAILPAVAISCTDKPKNEPDQSGENKEPDQGAKTNLTEAENQLKEVKFDVIIDGKTEREYKDRVYAHAIELIEDIQFELKGDANDKYVVIPKKLEQDIDNGRLNISYEVRYSKAQVEKNKDLENVSFNSKITVDGLKKGEDPAKLFNDLHNKDNTNKSLLKEYLTWDQSKRFEHDNKNYINAIKGQIGYPQNKKPEEITVDTLKSRKELSDSEIQNSRKAFDAKNKESKLDSFDNWYLKTFSLPIFDENGNFKGFSVNEASQFGIGPSWIDIADRNKFQASGYPRTILNDIYLRQALQTWHIEFANPAYNDYISEKTGKKERIPNKTITTAGTAWILDYELAKNGQYPTKWYIGTNLHVAQALTDETEGFSISRLDKDDTKVAEDGQLAHLASTGYDIRTNRFSFQLDTDKEKAKNNPIKIVYKATDYLNKDPKDYAADSHKKFLENKQEFADFAILELDLSKLNGKENANGFKYFSTFWVQNTPEITADKLQLAQVNLEKAVTEEDKNKARSEIAKLITNDYANLNEKDKAKFIKRDYLNNYTQIDRPLNPKQEFNGDSLYAVGWPRADYDYVWDKYADEEERKNQKWNYELWINKDSVVSIQNKKDGNWLSYGIGYRTINDKPGIVDAFISAPKNADKFFSYEGKEYVSVGLNYSPKHYAPFGGSSGTSIRNQNNELVAIFHTANNQAGAGLAVAFRSEGYDYNKIFKFKENEYYELPQYDLIYGGGKDQKTGASYREALKTLYNGKNMKTWLFQNGLSQIPEEYKFTKVAVNS
ncbi:Ig-specific serine endopeptidase MIP [Mycoplasmopsis opalescens]|uniref:Ig-specific serine endopeptidase MIP n=1 Tax=Mycoplasmopsis opalescens TaxID=114886 RepID=UPI0004A7143D|nr:DUF31 family protein [Mycoplasmopsis opalescens]